MLVRPAAAMSRRATTLARLPSRLGATTTTLTSSRRPLSTSLRLFKPSSTAPLHSSTTATQPHPHPPSESYHPAPTSVFTPVDTFLPRHVGPRDADVEAMLSTLGYKSLDDFVADTIPQGVRVAELRDTSSEGVRPYSELEMIRRAEEVAGMNRPMKSYIGMGYHNAIVPPIVQRNAS